ncbi:MAG: HipA domain-containing protein [Pseudomonadota bacterium]
MRYKIIEIPTDAREDTEQLGSKPKFWVLLDDKRWLFKESRPDTGEDWAEKVAAEIARAVGIRAATVELAEYDGRRGCVSMNFVDVKGGQALVHGNEVLATRFTGYDKGKVFGQSDHTLENIEAAMRGLFSSDQAGGVLTELAGYLVLDALIGNTDRHHENWGLLLHVYAEPPELVLTVAPSFDHASSLGRELRDEKRLRLIEEQRISSYVNKGRGGIFRSPEEPHGENPLRLVQLAARAYPSFFEPALTRVRTLSSERVVQIIGSLPDERASPVAKKFAAAMIFTAQASLAEILR